MFAESDMSKDICGSDGMIRFDSIICHLFTPYLLIMFLTISSRRLCRISSISSPVSQKDKEKSNRIDHPIPRCSLCVCDDYDHDFILSSSFPLHHHHFILPSHLSYHLDHMIDPIIDLLVSWHPENGLILIPP